MLKFFGKIRRSLDDCKRNRGMTMVYEREYELLKKAAFGDLKERMNAVKELQRFTTEALRNENGL